MITEELKERGNMAKYDYEKLEEEGKFDAHIFGAGKTMEEAMATKEASYARPFGAIFSLLLRMVASCVIPVILMVSNCVKIVGRRNIKGIKKAVSVSNHCLTLDSLVISRCFYPRQVNFPTIDNNIATPILGNVLKRLGAYSTGKTLSGRKRFIKQTNKLLEDENIVHFMPEGSMWPYYSKIRPFKDGAFSFAVKNDAPIIPICVSFRKKREGSSFFRTRAKFVTVHIGKPIYPDKELSPKEAQEKLRADSERTICRMSHFFKIVDENWYND